MSLKRYTKSVDGTIPVPALLYEDEDLLVSQDGVGIYDGTQKSAPHQAGTIYTTSHRLFYIDAAYPYSRSFEFDLAHVARTEHYTGLFTSSPKVTLHLYPLPASTQPDARSGTEEGSVSGVRLPTQDAAFDSWECEVCSFRNPPGLSPAASRVCALCGVPRSSVKPAVDIPSKSPISSAAHHLSSSLPSSSLNLPTLGMSSTSSSLSSNTLPAEQAAEAEVACLACTFLNHPSLTACEICGTPLPKKQRTTHPMAKSAPPSRPASPDVDDPVSFRRGGDRAWYGVLRRSLLGKGWEVRSVTSHCKGPADGPSASGVGQTGGFSGINGILRNVETTAVTAQIDLEDALQDLEALMVKWKDMVKLAKDLNERLTAAASSTAVNTASGAPPLTTTAVEPEEATFIRSSLSQLGLQMTNAPVTLDMMRDERRWTEELAKELAGVLQGRGREGEGVMRQRGIVGLDEVWGGWNRARGVALIPPSTFLQVLPLLPVHTSPPIHMRTFPSSGLLVLHTPPYTKAAFAARLVGLLSLAGPKSTAEVAQEDGLPIPLAQEMVSEVEDEGEICRDEGGSGIDVSAGGKRDGWAEGSGEVRWWVNVFRSYVWDGQAD
ncbi:EAP30/Vps36 family-domain-containing protein [Amylocystis lapponica]|nr:EAP30/Vps36 family-domain-containing protein [Amylocystis lapponica]